MKGKHKHKIISLFMAGVITTFYAQPVGGVLWAQEQDILESISISGKPVTKVLEKGDKFNLFIDVYTGSGINIDELRQSIQYIELSGSTSDSVDVQAVQIIDNQEIGSKTIVVMDLTYNGLGNTVNVEMGLRGAIGAVTGSIILENAQAAISAGEGVTVSQNVINVVAGEMQQIILTLKNNSKSYVESGKMKLQMKDSQSAKGIIIKKKEISLSSMSKGEQKDYYITLDISSNVTRGIHEMIVDIDGKEHVVKLKVDSNFMPPSLEVSVSSTTAFEQNTPKVMQIMIKNVGHVAAKNVKLEILPNEKVFVADGSNVRYIENIGSGKIQTVPISLVVNDTSTSNLAVEIKLSYIDDLGETQTSNQFIYLSTKGSTVQKELEIVTTEEPTSVKKIGEAFNIGFKVTAPDDAQNVKITVKSIEGIVSKTKSIFIEPKLTKGQSKSYQVTFVATQPVSTGTYPIEIVAEYTLNGKEIALQQYGTVSIENEQVEEGGEIGKSKPKVIIGAYHSNPIVVKAGEEFDLEIGFFNTHQSKIVKNLKANLTVKEQGENDTGSVFTPVNASNTFFIDTLEPGQTEQKSIRLYTIPSAKAKTYELTVEMEYEDEKGEAIVATEHFGIPVEQITKLEVAEVQVEYAEVGMPSEMIANIYNTGKTSISNIKISTVGESFEVQDNTLIVGTLEKGSSKSYMPTIIPNEAGTLQGQIQIEYEDVTGKVQTLTHDFQIEVMESVPPVEEFPTDEMPPMEEETNREWPVLLGVAVGVGIAAGITTWIMKRRKNKLDEMDLDED